MSENNQDKGAAHEGFERRASSESKRLIAVLLARHSCRCVNQVMRWFSIEACRSTESGAQPERVSGRVRAYRLPSSTGMMSPCMILMGLCSDPVAIARDTSASV